MIPEKIEGASFPNDHPRDAILEAVRQIREALDAVELAAGARTAASRPSLMDQINAQRARDQEADVRAVEAAVTPQRDTLASLPPLPPKTTTNDLRARAAALRAKREVTE